ncbi:MAG: peptide-methionine (S)-S-oxide reductase MsrA [Lysobacteraceae bacterium]
MTRRPRTAVATLGALLALTACNLAGARSNPVALPPPAQDLAPPPGQHQAVAVFAGGCFWGVEAVFDHVRGVGQAVSGYAGGHAGPADYQSVSTGSTGHAETVQVSYDPGQVSYGQLLQVFFSVAHDPTQLNRQLPDVGSQYRSEIFTTTPGQARVARAYIAQLEAAHAFPAHIVTRVEPLRRFYRAEDYHQDYLAHHPDKPYIVYNDAPKLVALKQLFPALYRE